MPAVTETTVPGFASCYDPRCPGYEQEELPVLKRVAEFSFVENGGDLPGIERSTIHAVDESVGPCVHCGGPRIASLERRPEYPRLSGQDPLALLDLDQQKQVHQVALANAQQATETATLRAELAELRAELASRPRGPGRPRKVEDDGE